MTLDLARRFCLIYEALNAEKGFWSLSRNRQIDYRATLVALGAPGSPEDVGQAIIQADSELREKQGFISSLTGELRLGIAAAMVRSGDSAAAFLPAFEAARREFREVGLRRSATYEAIAVLMHRSLHEQRPVTRSGAERLRTVYEALKTHHWWLTGPNDLPACALLSSLDRSPQQLGRDTEDIYQALKGVGQRRGSTLQTAAMFLVLCQSSPTAVAERFTALATAFKEGGVRLVPADQDELALLCFLDESPSTIVETVQRHRDEIGAQSRWTGKQETFELGVSTAALELADDHPELAFVNKAKALTDLVAVATEQAASAAV